MFCLLTRYEAIPFIVGIAFIIAIVIFKRMQEERKASRATLSDTFAKIEAVWLLLLTPSAFAVIVWLVYNYVITGNAFYFFNSVYSNVGQSGSIQNDANLAAIIGHPLGVLNFMLKRTMYFLVPFIIILINRTFKKKLFKIDFLIVLILVSSLYVMQFGLLMRGLSAAWLRYYVYILPITIAWLPYELENTKNFWKVSGMFTTFAITAGLTVFVITNFNIAPDQFNVFDNSQGQLTISTQVEISKYINEKYPNSIVYTDSFTTFSVILNSDNPQNIISSCNYDFEKILEDPKQGKIDFIIIPSPKTDLGKLDSINRKYPELYERGADWCKLDKSFNYFKVFKVIH